MNWSLLKNPFIRYAGAQAITIGFLIAIASAGLASLFHLHYDGILDAHFCHYKDSPSFFQSLFEQLINAVSYLLIFFPLAFIMGAGHTRLIDLAGTYLLARAPFLFLPFLNATGTMSNLGSSLLDNLQEGNVLMPELSGIEWAQIAGAAFILIAAVALYIHLLFQAWRTCTNLKHMRVIISFIAGLILAEAISKIAHFYFLSLN